MTTPTTPGRDEAREQALDLIREARSFLLVGHVRPDGDCIGAQGALYHGLRSLGKEVAIVNPHAPAPEFSYLSEACPYGVFEGGELPAHDVVCLLDFNDLDRTGAMADPIRNAGSKMLVVDHHPPSVEPFWDAAFVDVRASATGLLVWRILGALGAEVNDVAAKAIFTSIVTDTGWFRYSNTDAETLEVGTEMVRRGVDPATMYQAIYQRKPITEPVALAALLARAEYFSEGRLAVVDQPLGDPVLENLEDSDAVLDILRSVGSVEVVLYIRELKPGLCKLSARSKTSYDVNRLARGFGGGGHAKASGATIEGDLPEVRERLIHAAEEGFQRT
ncbi:MAG TPA: bifunctional oligoribonuclease/PAP phosphatase NrnA [Planctomycetes bacterium]|nr:bifunctional oligoribonuclease/PAP phosphatase NrnA [Planctomycetota bacterium]